ncbi:Signal transduction histidine kinase [Gemmobacter aquatilis]|uniref:histidine kinase n=1 Tax=Gemmobacter aquatilis TaxID=933059 RepID=A0A1H8DS35_9RHOB|nr:hypothetical protein [Gemmobacter aquatilis]SEN09976.1 Signal transduction histidine kinase [Gemmobacter aquatilis]
MGVTDMRNAAPSGGAAAGARRLPGVFNPVVRLSVALLAVLLAMGLVFVLRLAQPDLSAGQIDMARPGPVTLQHGGQSLRLLSLAPALGGKGAGVAIPADLAIEDPDMLPSYAARRAFLQAQAMAMALLRDAGARGMPLRATVQPAEGGPPFTLLLPVAAHSRLADLPRDFWVQIGCGLTVLLIAAFFFALRPGTARRRSAPEGLSGFVLAGLGVGGAGFCAAIYSSRALVMEPGLIFAASLGNHAFTFLFGSGMMALFARYPRPVLRWRYVLLSSAALLVSILLYRLELAPHSLIRPQNITGVIFLIIVALILLQLRATRRNPADRAALRWLGLSFLLGSGVFVMLVALPVVFEQESILSQGMSFIPLCAIYVGTALAFARYRLFDLDRWAWRILFHMGVICLLVCVDLLVMVTLSLSSPVAMAFAVLTVGLLYFPLRDHVFERWLAPRRPDMAAIYAGTVSIAFQIGPAAKAEAWRSLLMRLFAPLQMDPVPDAPPAPVLGDEGLSLTLPAQNGAPALRLAFAGGGRRLFNGADLALLTQVHALLRAAEADRTAYEAALHQERRRIARDLHDDVGANLLSALHSRDDAKRQDFLVEALADLRQIASGLAGRPVTLESQIAEMRAESHNRAEAQGRTLIWPLGSADASADQLGYEVQRNLTALHREALSNALAHGGPGAITIHADLDGDSLIYRMENPLGPTPPTAAPRRGNGLGNMAARAEALGGRVTARRDETAQRHILTLRIPLHASPTPTIAPAPFIAA